MMYYNALHTRISLLVGAQINNELNMPMPGFARYLQWRSISWLLVKPLAKRYHQMIWLKYAMYASHILSAFPVVLSKFVFLLNPINEGFLIA